MTVTPMLDKVRNYARRWGVRTSATHVSELYRTHEGPGIFAINWPTRTEAGLMTTQMQLEQKAMPLAMAMAAVLVGRSAKSSGKR